MRVVVSSWRLSHVGGYGGCMDSVVQVAAEGSVPIGCVEICVLL